MIRKSKITSLSELKTRQKQLRLETEVAKREFAHTIGTTRGNASSFLINKVALPVGGGILGLIVLSKLFSGGDSKKMPVIKETRVVHEYPNGVRPAVAGRKKSRFRYFKRVPALLTAIKVLAPLIQVVIGAFNTHKAQQAAHSAKRAAVRK